MRFATAQSIEDTREVRQKMQPNILILFFFLLMFKDFFVVFLRCLFLLFHFLFLSVSVSSEKEPTQFSSRNLHFANDTLCSQSTSRQYEVFFSLSYMQNALPAPFRMQRLNNNNKKMKKEKWIEQRSVVHVYDTTALDKHVEKAMQEVKRNMLENKPAQVA